MKIVMHEIPVREVAKDFFDASERREYFEAVFAWAEKILSSSKGTATTSVEPWRQDVQSEEKQQVVIKCFGRWSKAR